MGVIAVILILLTAIKDPERCLVHLTTVSVSFLYYSSQSYPCKIGKHLTTWHFTNRKKYGISSEGTWDWLFFKNRPVFMKLAAS